MAKLADWITSTYLDRLNVEEMRAEFAKGKQLLLPNFIRKDVFPSVLREANTAKFKRAYLPDQMSCGFSMKQDALLRFLSSKEFRAYITLITGIPSGNRAFYTEFKAGDYTILKDIPQSFKLITHYFISPWNEAWGGRMIFREKDGSHHYVHPDSNTLLITLNQKRLRGYVEYVNHHIGKKKLVAANV